MHSLPIWVDHNQYPMKIRYIKKYLLTFGKEEKKLKKTQAFFNEIFSIFFIPTVIILRTTSTTQTLRGQNVLLHGSSQYYAKGDL